MLRNKLLLNAYLRTLCLLAIIFLPGHIDFGVDAVEVDTDSAQRVQWRDSLEERHPELDSDSLAAQSRAGESPTPFGGGERRSLRAAWVRGPGFCVGRR